MYRQIPKTPQPRKDDTADRILKALGQPTTAERGAISSRDVPNSYAHTQPKLEIQREVDFTADRYTLPAEAEGERPLREDTAAALAVEYDESRELSAEDLTENDEPAADEREQTPQTPTESEV